jgi:hypothetical protein
MKVYKEYKIDIIRTESDNKILEILRPPQNYSIIFMQFDKNITYEKVLQFAHKTIEEDIRKCRILKRVKVTITDWFNE